MTVLHVKDGKDKKREMQQRVDKERRKGANLVLLEKSKLFPPSDDGNLGLFFFFFILYLGNLFAEMPLRQAEPNRGVTVAAAVPAEAALSFLSCGTCGSL